MANDFNHFNNCAKLLEAFVAKESAEQERLHDAHDRISLHSVRSECSRGNGEEYFIPQCLMKVVLLQELQCSLFDRRIRDGVFYWVKIQKWSKEEDEPDLINNVRWIDVVMPKSQQNSSSPCKCVQVVTVTVGAIVRVIAIFDSMLNRDDTKIW